MTDKPKHIEVVEANVAVHTAYAPVYNEQPHFRPENQAKVKKNLAAMREKLGSGSVRLLDMGCGTGFILHLAADLFDELHGVDVTRAMMDQVDTDRGNITLHLSPAESVPFEKESFDAVTAYSFMDHLLDLELFLKEVYRVMKPGGVFFSDQNANKDFWDGLAGLDPAGDYHAIVKREIQASLNNHEEGAEYGVSSEAFKTAEYIKFNENGIDGDKVAALARSIGFKDVLVEYDWFLGQGSVMHQQSFEASDTVEEWLRKVLPLSRHLFKYIRFVFVK